MCDLARRRRAGCDRARAASRRPARAGSRPRPRDALGPLHRVATQLAVDRRTLRATLRRAGRAVLTVRIGVGAAATPTPAGRYWIREKLRFAARPVDGTPVLIRQVPTEVVLACGRIATPIQDDLPGTGYLNVMFGSPAPLSPFAPRVQVPPLGAPPLYACRRQLRSASWPHQFGCSDSWM